MLILSTLVLGQLPSYWRKEDSIPTPTLIYDIKIGKGRNDDTERLYAGTWGSLLEYTYRDSTWEVDTCVKNVYLSSIDFGYLRYDSIQRIYGAGAIWIYEFTYNNNIWECETIGYVDDPIQDYVYSLIIGQGRNDDTSRIYLGHWNDRIYELTYRDTIWVMDSIPPLPGSVQDIVIGDGRNDGNKRIYVGGTANTLQEITYSSSGWQTINFGWAPGTYEGIAIGKGRNDGINRIYAWSFHATPPGFSLYQWTGPPWWGQIIGDGNGFEADVVVSKARDDSLFRVYGATNGNVYEFEYSTGWYQYHIDSVDGYNRVIAVGNGRNDGVNRLYVGFSNGYIYEYTWIPSGFEDNITSIPKKVKFLTISPNPFRRQTKIICRAPESNKTVLSIYDIDGRLCSRYLLYLQANNEYSLLWPGFNEKIPGGVYICVYEYNNTKYSIKLVKFN